MEALQVFDDPNKITDVVIVDDDKTSRMLIERNLRKLFPHFNIAAICSTEEEGIRIINKIQPQIIFLDIELDKGTGFDLCEKIKYSQKKIIYVSSEDKYLFDAFKFEASDFILKPIRFIDIYKSVNKVLYEITQEINLLNIKTQLSQKLIVNQQNFKRDLDFIAIPAVDKIEFLKMEKILYLKSEGRYTTIILDDQSKITSSKNLGEYEKMLSVMPEFFRVHNSYLVNLRKVISIDKSAGNYCVMINSDLVPIAKRKILALNNFLKLK